MKYEVDPDLVIDYVKGDTFIVMGQKYLKEMGATKAGPLDLLL